ncbi:hypothetical protein [Actinoplanes regularis]|uniref:Uncharacterized protein n=1 Tax=Actinoplanes regularis TaxID=52697 RepID=A0A239BCD9_9ACTN|nr:hypothetical protein [Actinoplanes regularis]GIE87903.1 hypothetical protein Are01nite_43830 [Actinoplanes regularis]SNS05359.1 hypothetical protein SAMN06264365_109105 [Actinoplanes regularis]
MNIRLMGDGDQVAAMVAALENAPGLHVTRVSRPYANRRDPEQMRIYLDAAVTADPRRAGGCPDCVCDPAACRADQQGQHCMDVACGACLHGCPTDEHDMTWPAPLAEVAR